MKRLIFTLILTFASVWAIGQGLQPTETKALLEVAVTDFEDVPRPSEIVIFTSEKSGKKVKKVTGPDGTFKILLPKGDTYSINYKSFLDEKQSSSVEIPTDPGLMEARLTVQMESASRDVFELDIHFETDKSIIQEESFPVLNDLVEQMKLKPDLTIEIGGHTDDVGDATYNQKLSLNRANAVRQYISEHGVAASRMQTKGYGESKPRAKNDSDANRAANRRTEIRILSGWQ